MKKVVSLLIAVLLCVSMAGPVCATEVFVPSISAKQEPALVAPDGQEGIAGVVLDEDGEPMENIEDDCLYITPVSGAKDSDGIPEAAKQALLAVYEGLSDGTMVLPYEDLNLDPNDMVIRDLIDVSWVCSDHTNVIDAEGVTLELTFDLGVAADTEVYVMTYKNDKWNPVTNVTNNGDGTVTCVFEHLCPVVFAVEASSVTPPAQTGDNFDVMMWTVVLVVSAGALLTLVTIRRKTAQ